MCLFMAFKIWHHIGFFLHYHHGKYMYLLTQIIFISQKESTIQFAYEEKIVRRNLSNNNLL